MHHSPAELAGVFRRQAAHCGALRSPLWAQASDLIAADIESRGPYLALLVDWDGDLERGYLPLRVLGGLHYLALAGRAPLLAAQLPSTGGQPGPGLWPAIAAALAANRVELRRGLESPPQTNEIGRSAVFLGGFLEVADRSRLPLHLLEIGASAGLNLCWDRFAYRLGPHRWQGVEPVLTLDTDWRGVPPRLDAPIVVASRHACDQRPVDLADPEARLRLQGYVWPDQVDRLAALRAGIDVATRSVYRVDKADALAWTADRLASRPMDAATVVYHSAVLQYFDREERRRFAAMLETAGRESTARNPLAWLAFEQTVPDKNLELRLTYWPGGEHRHLATAQPHGRWVEWLDQPPG